MLLLSKSGLDFVMDKFNTGSLNYIRALVKTGLVVNLKEKAPKLVAGVVANNYVVHFCRCSCSFLESTLKVDSDRL